MSDCDTVVNLELREGYAIVTLNRPQAMNALSRQLRKDFVRAFQTLATRPDIRVAIITGSGKAFCAGFDLKELAGESGDQGGAGNAAEIADNAMARAVESFAGPVIAAVNGHAITGGFELALACDFIIASSEARFADTHARVGILPGWGLSQRLPRLIGLARAKELSFTGNPLYAQQACEWGLVNRVVAPDQLLPVCEQLAQDMLRCQPQILLQYKQLIDEGYNLPLDEALRWEEQRGIESAREASAAIIASRRDQVLERGRGQ